MQPQMEEFLSSYVSENTSVAYTSTKLLKEQLDSVRSMILVIGGLIGCIMAFAGLINFTNMIITNIITRRHEFATMQSIGMTGKQLRRLMVYEASIMPPAQTLLAEQRSGPGSHGAKERIKWPLHVVLYPEHYIGSCSGHWCALSAAGCGHSADCSPLL